MKILKGLEKYRISIKEMNLQKNKINSKKCTKID